MLYALAGHFDWWQNRMMTEFDVDGGRADLVFVSRSGYLTEIEVKVSRADWNVDQKKRKFARPRPHVARFFYAVPDMLAADLPPWLPPEAGVIVVHGGEYSDQCSELRPAKRVRAQKISESMSRTLVENCYYRFWRSEMNRWRQALHGKKARAA